MPRTDYDDVFDQQGNLISSTPRVVTDREIYLEQIHLHIAGGPMAGLTPDQAEAWIDSNVTSLAGARAALKILARIVLAMRDRQP